jgi:hypothetical protein
VSSNETQTTQSANPQNELLLGTVPESSSTLPSRSIRIDVNLVGLLARVSSNGSCLPNAFLRQWRIRFASPRLQWRGRSGFAPDSQTKLSRKRYKAIAELSQVIQRRSRKCRTNSDIHSLSDAPGNIRIDERSTTASRFNFPDKSPSGITKRRSSSMAVNRARSTSGAFYALAGA